MRHRENDDDLLMERYQNVMKNNDIFSDNNDSFVCKMSKMCVCVKAGRMEVTMYRTWMGKMKLKLKQKKKNQLKRVYRKTVNNSAEKIELTLLKLSDALDALNVEKHERVRRKDICILQEGKNHQLSIGNRKISTKSSK